MSRLSHKRGRKSNYVKKSLSSEYWAEVRKKIIFRDRCCQKCGSKLFLEVHHKTYYVDKESIVGKELEHLDKLVLLCSKCHKKEHKK